MTTKQKHPFSQFRHCLVCKGKRWYIEYYQTNPDSGELVRHRETHQLNRIKNLIERAAAASEIVAKINAVLPQGYPYKSGIKDKKKTNIIKAINIAFKVKSTTDRVHSLKSYKSAVKIFFKYLKENHLDGLGINSFSRSMALDYMDYLIINRNIGNRTYNNYRERMSLFFNFLEDRDYIDKNPFSKIPKKKISRKIRRSLSAQEKFTISEYIKKEDEHLFTVISLIYHCFLRPIEITRLQVGHINFDYQTINLPGHITKNRNDAVLTIPDALMGVLEKYKGLPNHFFLIGIGISPGTQQILRPHTYNERHRRYLKKLLSDGLLDDISGISLYSWKDTGAMDMLKTGVNIIELMKHLRHSDLNVTQKYLEILSPVIPSIKNSGLTL